MTWRAGAVLRRAAAECVTSAGRAFSRAASASMSRHGCLHRRPLRHRRGCVPEPAGGGRGQAPAAAAPLPRLPGLAPGTASHDEGAVVEPASSADRGACRRRSLTGGADDHRPQQRAPGRVGAHQKGENVLADPSAAAARTKACCARSAPSAPQALGAGDRRRWGPAAAADLPARGGAAREDRTTAPRARSRPLGGDDWQAPRAPTAARATAAGAGAAVGPR